MKKKSSVWMALALTCSLALGSFAGAGAVSAEEAEYKDTIVWVIGNDQDTLDPQMNVSNAKVIPQYYEGLVGFDTDGNVVCRIAESYESSEDKLTWTFHLRDDVYFHSGKQCTSADFQATFDRLLDQEHPVRHTASYTYIESTEAVDDFTFVIHLAQPKAFFLESIASQVVMNADYIEKYGTELGNTAESVDGCGPFKCGGWTKGEEMIFERFDDYYGDVAETETVIMKIVAEQTSRAIAIETGEADIADGISPDDAVRLDELDGITVSKTDGNGCHVFQFNCKSDNTPIQDPKVRLAICYAIDRETICDYLYSGLGEEPIDSIMAPSVAGYSSVGVLPYDVDKAKELLAEAGYADGFDMTIMTTDVYNRGVEMGEILVEELKEVGINVTLEVVELAVFSSAWGGFTPEEFNEQFGWDMFIMGSGGASNADTLLYRIMHSSENNTNNYGFYSNAEVDELLEKGAVTIDEEERDECYRRIAEIVIYEDPFGCYMNLRKNVYALSDKIENFSVKAANTMNLARIRCRA
ncbi:MAG: ABC transporter substrate-binding protein [Lachnospiraceae bacterium]|nr:ABC transporter substrate-binding protein [Lachnospiraceae bacterium]